MATIADYMSAQLERQKAKATATLSSKDVQTVYRTIKLAGDVEHARQVCGAEVSTHTKVRGGSGKEVKYHATK